ncbi:MAG TPA: PLP-dependent aminotransferase family protein [Longimicrobiales bacterium]
MKRTTFDFPMSIIRDGREPLRTQVVRELRGAVQSGRLRPGSALPSTRSLASDLGISRGLVVEAYEQLVAEGYLIARRGSATRVAGRTTRPPQPRALPASVRSGNGAAPEQYDFRPGIPDISLFPRRAWLRALRRAWAGDASMLDYPEPHGPAAARAALAAYLNRSRATVAEEERIVLCTGFAQAARLVAEALQTRGVYRIAVEDPGHVEQCADIRAAGIELVPVPVDDGGLRIDALRAADVRAVLVTPAHQYPTGAVLAPERRAALLEWAEAGQAYIVEDDYDAEYRYDRAPVGALQGLAPEHVIYIGSASKMLAPSLRQGWLLLPSALIDAVRQAKLSADRGSPVVDQLALGAFLEAGDLDQHLRRTRVIYRRRRDVLVEALRAHIPELELRGVAAGLHLMVDLPHQLNEAYVVEHAAAERIRVYGARAYFINGNAARPGLLLGYGGIAESQIEAGVKILARIIHGPA